VDFAADCRVPLPVQDLLTVHQAWRTNVMEVSQWMTKSLMTIKRKIRYVTPRTAGQISHQSTAGCGRREISRHSQLIVIIRMLTRQVRLFHGKISMNLATRHGRRDHDVQCYSVGAADFAARSRTTVAAQRFGALPVVEHDSWSASSLGVIYWTLCSRKKWRRSKILHGLLA